MGLAIKTEAIVPKTKQATQPKLNEIIPALEKILCHILEVKSVEIIIDVDIDDL